MFEIGSLDLLEVLRIKNSIELLVENYKSCH